MKTYTVEVFKYPEMITVQAKNRKEAKQEARKQVDYVPWEIKVL